MSAEPLSREEREDLCRRSEPMGWDYFGNPWHGDITPRYEATVQEREATLARVRDALAALDGLDCHEGCTDADHLLEARTFVDEVRAALEGAS